MKDLGFEGNERDSSRIYLAIWFAGLIVWTYLLVVPVEWLPPWFRFGGSGTSPVLSLNKLGHAMAFATLAAMAFLMPMGLGGRLGLLGLLSFHAFATEYIQTFVPTRTGCWMDVGIDHTGIFAGLALATLWSWQRKPSPVQAHQDAGRENQNADLLRHG